MINEQVKVKGENGVIVFELNHGRHSYRVVKLTPSNIFIGTRNSFLISDDQMNRSFACEAEVISLIMDDFKERNSF